MNDEILKYISMMKTFNSELMELNIKYSDQIEKYKDIVLDLENERDILKSKLSETKADIKYLLENGEGNGYIRNKYIRGDNGSKYVQTLGFDVHIN